MFTIGFPQRCTIDSHTLLYRGETFKADCTRLYEAKATMAGCMSWEAIMAVQWRDHGTLYRSIAVFNWYSIGGHTGCTMDVTTGVIQYMAVFGCAVSRASMADCTVVGSHIGCTMTRPWGFYSGMAMFGCTVSKALMADCVLWEAIWLSMT